MFLPFPQENVVVLRWWWVIPVPGMEEKPLWSINPWNKSNSLWFWAGERLNFVLFGLLGVSEPPVLRSFWQLFSSPGLCDLRDGESRAVAWP